MPKTPYRTTVEAIERLTSTVKVFRLRFDPGADFDFVAGQYVMIDIPKDEGFVQKAYSIASSPAQRGAIDLCVKLVEGGYVSTFFHRSLDVGSTLTVYEPQGFFTDRGGARERLYVATGTGIAPIRSMIRALSEAGPLPPMWLYFGVRYEGEILYEQEWRQLAARYSTFRFMPVISRPTATWTGDVGRVQQVLRKYVSGPADKEAYVCGVVPMVKEVKPLLLQLGVPRSQIHTEKYT